MRPPSVFVRPLAPFEGQRLKRLSKQAKHSSTRQRAAILLASATMMSAPEIAEMWMTDESHVRKVIHEFNQHGFASLRPRFGGGRPRRISTDEEARIVAVAGARPDTLGVPLTRWRTRSWKASPDPAYEARAARVLELYRCQPGDGVVISFDEMGPVSLCPHQGRGWAQRHRPERHRATYTRRHGVRYLVGALDVHADYLRARLRPSRDGSSTLTFMRQIRLAYPASIRIYWIQDNLSCHWTPAIRAWAECNNVELVPTPTYASYLNRIESHFGAIGEFVVKNADYLDWDSFALAMSKHISYRNDPARRRQRLERAAKRLNLAA